MAAVLVLIALAAVVSLVVFVVLPAASSLLPSHREPVEAGVEVSVTIPEGASGDTIASLLSDVRVIDNPKDYYAAVNKLDAALSI